MPGATNTLAGTTSSQRVGTCSVSSTMLVTFRAHRLLDQEEQGTSFLRRLPTCLNRQTLISSVQSKSVRVKTELDAVPLRSNRSALGSPASFVSFAQIDETVPHYSVTKPSDGGAGLLWAKRMLWNALRCGGVLEGCSCQSRRLSALPSKRYFGASTFLATTVTGTPQSPVFSPWQPERQGYYPEALISKIAFKFVEYRPP
jgi:hypothetical protein